MGMVILNMGAYRFGCLKCFHEWEITKPDFLPVCPQCMSRNVVRITPRASSYYGSIFLGEIVTPKKWWRIKKKMLEEFNILLHKTPE